MDAIGLNPIKLDAIGLDPIRMNAIRLGVPGASFGSGRPYIDPELLSHVKMVISTWGKTNDDPDRAVLKDLSGNGNDMRLLNFGFTKGSGYGLYGANYMDYTSNEMQLSVHTDTKISGYNQTDEGRMAIKLLVSTLDNIPSYKIKVTNLVHTIRYYYIDPENPSVRTSFPIKTNGVYELPASRNDIYNGESVVNVGFAFDGNGGGATIEQLPDLEGWLCTDGVDDMIVSEKTVDEMIGDSKECTVISIINYISDIAASTNVFGRRYIRNSFIGNGIDGKYYICGYTSENIDERGNVTVINDILGDKNDFSAIYVAAGGVADYFSVNGYLDTNNVPQRCAKIAYAGGFLANKALTTDEINQIIAYFNLDRPGQIIKPQLYCNIKKQGITNDNHAEFNDQLIDFVNGYNIQLNNIAWEGESGINSYPVVFGANKTWNIIQANNSNWSYELTHNTIKVTKAISNVAFTYSYVYRNGIIQVKIPSFEVKITGIKTGQYVVYKYVAEDNPSIVTTKYIDKDGIYTLPRSVNLAPVETPTKDLWVGFRFSANDIDLDITIEILPTIENALCLDGISDFGKATGLPILKDYTVVADRKILGNNEGGTLSKSYSAGNGAFIFETGSVIYSFGTGTSGSGVQSKRMLSYLSKYIYNGNPVQAGAGIDSDSMWLGKLRDNDTRFAKLALRSLLLFSYTLSEFLLERQLKKYNAGTLYPGMIELRPIVKSNIPYLRILYFITSTGDQIIKGSYIPIGSVIQINIQTVNATDEISSVSVNGKEVDMYNKDETYWRYRFKATKSPQKISIVISSYLTMLNNDTLISNETLIKNE